MRLSGGIFAVLLLLACTVQAQRARFGVVKGLVQDSANRQPVEAATISVFLQKDSSLVNYVLTNRKGEFQIKDVPVATPCKLLISYNGLKSHLQEFTIPEDQSEAMLGTIRLGKSVKELEEVMVVGMRPPMVIKKDTIEFNAGAFKTVPNAVLEDLVRQLPGIDVDSKGNLTMNGKKIEKITIDGKDFFANDPMVALKNLPKNIIDKVQVVDYKTREAQFNKTTTGNENKVLNLTLKKDQNQGWFGRASGGYGSEKRYEGGVNLNSFSKTKQIAVLANGNNTNRGSYGGGSFSIASAQSSLGGGGTGFTDNKSGGLNFTNVFSPKLTLSSSYFYNRSFYENVTKTQRQNITETKNAFYNSVNSNNNTGSNHRVNVNLDYRPDSSTSMNLTMGFNRDDSKPWSNNDASTRDISGKLINTSVNTLNGKSTSDNFAAEFFIGHRFKKEGRSLSMNLSYGNSKTNGEDYNAGRKWILKDDLTDSVVNLDQQSKSNGKNNTYLLSIGYTEPILKDLNVLFRYSYSVTKGNSDKATHKFNPETKQYDLIDPELSDAFTNRSEISNPDVSFNYFKNNRFRASTGLGLQWLRQQNTSLIQKDMDQKYLNYFPSANFTWQMSKTGEVSFAYNGRSEQPTAQQLQPVPDNSNPLLITLGNPDLKPAFNHNLNLTVRQSKGQCYWYGGLGLNVTSNMIGTEIDFDVDKQTMKPININGNYAVNGNLTLSKSWKAKDFNFRMNSTLGAEVRRDISMVSKQKVETRLYNWMGRLFVSGTYKDLINIMPSYFIRISDSKYNPNAQQSVSNVSHQLSVDLFLNWPKRLIIENNVGYIYNSNIAPGFRKSITSWNAAAMYQILKDNKGVLRVAIYDILKQNSNVNRSMTATYVQDVQVQVLQQYVMVSFLYNFSQFGGKKK
ncbi:outer membrane beta-barrel protein [Pseudoflavitalea sp. G-6-1-2]|uniref:outer membrane beta-barrel protein n=1 Tax=Pseudoflavitalea sp. G-6-1-2 TaxID=2728841 RepID=UPI00146CD948|nr:outer membrane beta-barrel protein [Pseudoflavitalea sp. G-6-1-2]NML19780.1 outer membrane beta-barrel protein [Pseudoflavitalea sp. G-6-1-2]